eukprot:937874-Amphidinium_carterae.1
MKKDFAEADGDFDVDSWMLEHCSWSRYPARGDRALTEEEFGLGWRREQFSLLDLDDLENLPRPVGIADPEVAVGARRSTDTVQAAAEEELQPPPDTHEVEDGARGAICKRTEGDLPCFCAKPIIFSSSSLHPIIIVVIIVIIIVTFDSPLPANVIT